MSHAVRSNPEPLVLPRGLIFVSSLWLIGSWVLTIGLHPPIQPSSATYEPGVRLMLLAITVGLVVAWPLLRLSQRPMPYPIRQTILDMVVLLSLVQVVIWLLRLLTSWSVARMTAIDATMASWIMLIGAVIASATATRTPGPRMLAMAACIALAMAGPATSWLAEALQMSAPGLAKLSPFVAVGDLVETSGGSQPTAAEWRWVMTQAGGAALVWAVVFVLRVFRRAHVGA